MARALGCPATSVTTYDELLATLPGAISGLRESSEPLLIEVSVAA
jgi:hypothetical protein